VQGLDPPDEVQAATEEYRDEMDILGDFLKDCCIVNPKAEVTTKALYKIYEQWCEQNGERPLAKNPFSSRLAERGLERARIGKVQDRGFSGIGLKNTHHPNPMVLDTQTHTDADSENLPWYSSL